MRVRNAILGMGLLLFSAVGATSGDDVLARGAKEEFILKAGGSADLVRIEEVPASELGKIYVAHGKAVESDTKVRDNMLMEASKAYQQIYNLKTKLVLSEQTIGDATVRRTLKGEFRGLAKADPKEKEIRVLNVRQFPDEKVDEKRLLGFYEGILDGRILESAILGSIKGDQTLKGTTVTVFRLPEGATIENLKDLADKGWKVDFGGGNQIEGGLAVNEKDGTVTYTETITVTEKKPDLLLSEKTNETLFEALRNCGSFVIRYREKPAEGGGKASDASPAPDPSEPEAAGLDFSGSWNTTFSHTLTKAFTYQTASITPSVVLSLALKAEITWTHNWVKVSWWRWKYKLQKFETKITVTPGADADVTVSTGGNVDKEWEQDIVTKSTTFTFSVAFVPVVIQMEANLKVGAKADLEGVITVSAGAKASITNVLTVKWENGWSKSNTFTKTLTFKSLTANARVEATARASAPLRVSAYLYSIAGPFAEADPWIQAHSLAQAGSTTGISYDVTTGIDLNGGASMAGWLKSLCDDLPSYSTTFTTVGPFTITSGTKNVTP